MLGKKYMHSRGVMIAIAVVALMTLTAGVAAAASAKAKNINASGGVTEVGLALDGTVESKFRIKNDVIKSVEIKTNGENVGGFVTGFDAASCKEHGKHSEGSCAAAGLLLGGAGIASTHNSTARLNVKSAPVGTLTGFIKGDLKSTLTVTSQAGDVLEGSAKLKIRSKGEMSTYGCLLGFEPVLPYDQIYGPIAYCMASPGPNSIGPYVVTDPHTLAGFYPGDGGPVLVPVDLHVTDKGTFKISSETSGTTLKGKIQVEIDAPPTGEHGPFAGTILISKGEATFPIDEPEGKKPKKHDDD